MEITFTYDNCEVGHEAIVHQTRQRCPLCEISELRKYVDVYKHNVGTEQAVNHVANAQIKSLEETLETEKHSAAMIAKALSLACKAIRDKTVTETASATWLVNHFLAQANEPEDL